MMTSAGPPELPGKTRKKFPWTIYLVVLALIVAGALAPVASVVAGSTIANAYGCQVDEGSAHPCVIGGQDRGETLYAMFVLGWLMLLTLPAGALAGSIWLVTLLVHHSSWRARRAG